MLIRINILIQNIVLDWILVHFFHFQILDWGENVVIFEADNSTLVHIDNNKKDILVLGKDQTQELDDTTITAEAKYSINFSRLHRKFCLSLHYNGSNSFLFVNATKIYKFKANYSEIKTYQLCLGNISIT